MILVSLAKDCQVLAYHITPFFYIRQRFNICLKYMGPAITKVVPGLIYAQSHGANFKKTVRSPLRVKTKLSPLRLTIIKLYQTPKSRNSFLPQAMIHSLFLTCFWKDAMGREYMRNEGKHKRTEIIAVDDIELFFLIRQTSPDWSALEKKVQK